jgi:hypothetical protein
MNKKQDILVFFFMPELFARKRLYKYTFRQTQKIHIHFKMDDFGVPLPRHPQQTEEANKETNGTKSQNPKIQNFSKEL